MNLSDVVANRASARLNGYLNQIGVPRHLAGRTEYLSLELAISRQDAQFLLSGLVSWKWDDIERVCRLMSCTIGALTDPVGSADIPQDAVAVQSADGGSTTVWRPPNESYFTELYRSHALRYRRMQLFIGGEPVFALAIYALIEGKKLDDTDIGHDFLLDITGEYSIAKLKKIVNGQGVFSARRGGGISSLLPLDNGIDGIAGHEIIGEIVGYMMSQLE